MIGSNLDKYSGTTHKVKWYLKYLAVRSLGRYFDQFHRPILIQVADVNVILNIQKLVP